MRRFLACQSTCGLKVSIAFSTLSSARSPMACNSNCSLAPRLSRNMWEISAREKFSCPRLGESGEYGRLTAEAPSMGVPSRIHLVPWNSTRSVTSRLMPRPSLRIRPSGPDGGKRMRRSLIGTSAALAISR
ncbi:hypothetical protein D3C84_881640 [compost metagenome]